MAKNTTGFDIDFDLIEIMMTAAGYNSETDLTEFIAHEYGLMDGEDYHLLNHNSIIYNVKNLSKDKLKAMNKLKNSVGIR